MTKPVAVIPSRYASVRFPGKPLAALKGKPMVQHVYERCMQSDAFSKVLVATEDERIMKAVASFGGVAVMTSESCQSGTDCVAEVARTLPSEATFINVQGDEPLVHPESLRILASAFNDGSVAMATLVRPLEDVERSNPNVVKVVLAESMDALYFSRADIPFQRDPDGGAAPRYAHLGLYGYTRAALLRIAALQPSPLEQAEKLEQLRALENGIRIRCLVTAHKTVSVDTPEDARRVEALLPTQSPSIGGGG